MTVGRAWRLGTAVGVVMACLVVGVAAPAAFSSPLAAGPMITDVSPNAVSRGDVDDVLVVTGSNFAPNAIVSVSGGFLGITVTNTSIDSDTQITAHVSVATDAWLYSQTVDVTNPGDGQQDSFLLTMKARNGPAVFRQGVWFVRHSFTTGIADTSFSLGNADDQPRACPDTNNPAFRNPSVFRTGSLGNPGDIGICGLWRDMHGQAAVLPHDGVYRPSTSTFFIRIVNPVHPSLGYHFDVVALGNPNDIPVLGDWDGDGITNLGVVRNGVWYLDMNNDTAAVNGIAATTMVYGNPGDIPVVGDWDGDGKDSPGVVRDGVWLTVNTLASGFADTSFSYGNAGDLPLSVAT